MVGLVYASNAIAQEEHTEEDKQQYAREVDQVFEGKCTACHERTVIDLESKSVSMRGWMHIVERMRKKAPEWISEDEAQLIQREYIERIKTQLEELERQLKLLEEAAGF